MKTSTLLLLGGAAVVGYLYAKRQGSASTPTAMQAQALAAAAPAPTVNVVVDRDDYGPDYGHAFGWGVPVFGARSWGGFRGGHGGHGRHHGGGRGGGR